MSLHQKLRDDIRISRSAKDTTKIKQLSTVLSDVENNNLKLVKSGATVADEEVIKVVRKFINGIEETIGFLSADEVGNHDILVDLEFEKLMLLSYLPRQIEGEELQTACELAVNKSGASSVKEMGKAMGVLKATSNKEAFIYDGKEASTIIRKILLES